MTLDEAYSYGQISHNGTVYFLMTSPVIRNVPVVHLM